MVQHPGAAKLVIALVVIVVHSVGGGVVGVVGLADELVLYKCILCMAFMASSWTCGGNHFSVESAAVT